MRFVPTEPIDFKPVVKDKRGVQEVVPDAPAAPTPAPRGEGSVAAGEREGAAAAPPPDVLAAVQQVDFLKLGDQFIVRDVTYRVVSVLSAQNALVIAPVGLGRATMKKMRKAGRS